MKNINEIIEEGISKIPEVWAEDTVKGIKNLVRQILQSIVEMIDSEIQKVPNVNDPNLNAIAGREKTLEIINVIKQQNKVLDSLKAKLTINIKE